MFGAHAALSRLDEPNSSSSVNRRKRGGKREKPLFRRVLGAGVRSQFDVKALGYFSLQNDRRKQEIYSFADNLS